jgi:hypothetical protein
MRALGLFVVLGLVFGVGARAELFDVAAEGDADGDLVAVGVEGDATAHGTCLPSVSSLMACTGIAVSVAGDSSADVAVSGTGSATQQCTPTSCFAGIAASPAGPASGQYAASGQDNAAGEVVGVSGTGDASGWLVALSGAGDASSDWVAVGGAGAAACEGDGCSSLAVVAASLAGDSVASCHAQSAGASDCISIGGGSSDCHTDWNGDCISAAVAGTATSRCGLGGSYVCVAAALMGDAETSCGFALGCIAASSAGDATCSGPFTCLAASAQGDASCEAGEAPCVAVSGTGEAAGDIAISAL